jgi:asparagine synthase (glutamine-hydrolysing)
MCGIAAVVDEDGASALTKAQKAIAILSHRGPDGSAVWRSADGTICLAHARLATIDSLSGQQPMANERNTIVVVVNGEFYDTADLRVELEELGHQFRTRSDSEILIHLYERHGTSCLEYLQGEFAFILWDGDKRRLFAARDRFGVKPLYYSQQKGGIAFSSEVKGLKEAGVVLAWDEQGFFEKFIFQAGLGGRTLYQNVFELPAGHYLLYADGRRQLHQYWDICYPTEGHQTGTETDGDAPGRLAGLLERAVVSRMRADVPVVCYLSGGIDSNAILGLLARYSPGPIEAYSLSFEDAAFDEFDLAAQSAARVGAHLTKVFITDSGLAFDFRRTVWHCEDMIRNAAVMAKFCLSRAVNQAGYRVVLTGDGSDEIFAGYPIFVIDSLRYGSPKETEYVREQLGTNTERLQVLLNPPRRNSTTLTSRLGYVPAWFDGCHRVLDQFAGIFSEAIADIDIDARLLDSVNVAGQLNGRSFLNKSLYIHSKTSLPGVTLSSLGDRVEMAHSVEGRLPFLDNRVVDFARTLPSSQKIRNGVEKFVLRNAMRTLVSPEVCGRRKRALQSPPVLSNKHSALGQLVQDTLRSASLERIPFLNKAIIRRLLDQIPTMDASSIQKIDEPLMALSSACILSEEFSL